MEESKKEKKKAQEKTFVGRGSDRPYHEHRHRGSFGAVLLITIGIILLLNNFNVLPWSVWESLWKFWPLILIFAGIETIFGRSWIGSLIGTLFGLTIAWVIVANVLSITVPEFNNWLMQYFPQSKIEFLQNFFRERGVR